MSSNRLWWLVVIGLFIGITAGVVRQLQADASKGIGSNPKLVEAATAAYQCTQAEYALARATVEDVYQWSRRLMDAEKSRDSAAAHVGRMQELHDKVAALHRAGVAGGSARDFESTKFYLLEAQSYVVRR